MKTRNLFWGVVSCGIVGALLFAGTAGAASPSLKQCQANLNTCTADPGDVHQQPEHVYH